MRECSTKRYLVTNVYLGPLFDFDSFPPSSTTLASDASFAAPSALPAAPAHPFVFGAARLPSLPLALVPWLRLLLRRFPLSPLLPPLLSPLRLAWLRLLVVPVVATTTTRREAGGRVVCISCCAFCIMTTMITNDSSKFCDPARGSCCHWACSGMLLLIVFF
jgi:hypothetical protein